jgi:lysophospholipase L1-like esterase
MDLCAAVPYFSMDERLREKIWDDGLHLTKAGYKMMGDAIGARMTELLSAGVR